MFLQGVQREHPHDARYNCGSIHSHVIVLQSFQAEELILLNTWKRS